MKNKIKLIAKWIDDQVKKSNTKGVVFGLSGGIDSALLAFIIKNHCKCDFRFYWLGVESDNVDFEDAMLVSKKLKVNLESFDLTQVFIKHKKTLGLNGKLPLMNLKARIRSSSLYALAQEINYLVCGTSNAAELYVGYFTKFGDSACDLLPLANLKKHEIIGMSKILGVPKKIIDKKPSAGLYKGQTDEGEMGVSYKEIDLFLENKKINKNSKVIIVEKHKKNLHKLRLPNRPKL